MVIKRYRNTDYYVSSDGRVASMKSKKWLRCSIVKGYKYIKIKVDGKRKNVYVHRMVAECFLGESTLEVNHIDGNKMNNNVENLEYATHKDNMEHAYKNGLIDSRGSRNGMSKLNEDLVLEIKTKLKDGFKRKDLAKEYGVSCVTIGEIDRGEKWRHVE